MKRTASVRLLPTANQPGSPRRTLETCSAACALLAGPVIHTKSRGQHDLHKLACAEMRVRFGLSPHAAVRCIAKVADSLKAGSQGTRRRFHHHATQLRDARIFRFPPDQDAISIWTLPGRIRIPFACGDRQRVVLRSTKGELDLMFVRGEWLLSATCDVADQPMAVIADVTGVDLGLVNLAVDDWGVSFSGEPIEKVRRRRRARRTALQKKRTRSTRRALRRASGRQARFQRHTNRVIEKAIVADGERDRCMIALQGPEGIRERVQAERHQRARMANWGFAELRSLIEHKAALKGIGVVLIDPRHTSQQCACCSLIDRRNRLSRDSFRCIGCGFAAPADHNAALVIRRRDMRATSFVMALEETAPRLPLVSPRESGLL